MKETGATHAVTRKIDQLGAWAMHHREVCLSTIRQLLANPVASLMTWLVIGIALALPAILYVVLQNVSMVSGDWGGKPRVSLYLTAGVDMSTAQALALEIQGDVAVERTEFISSGEALIDFQERSGFGDVLSTLSRNPLPHLIEVTPLNPDPMVLNEQISQWKANDLVERVSVDMQWLERLFALLAFAERLVSALGVVLAAGVILVMGNTIRLAIENRRQEIEIIKLVGGTDSFVRRPFLYLGFWYGLGGAVSAFVLLQLSLLVLSSPVEALAISYRDEFALEGPGIKGGLALIGVGVSLGVLGALLAVSRHLSEIEPS